MPQFPDFNIIAVRILQDGTTGQRILKANKIYYLQKGFCISEDKIVLNAKESTIVSLYDDYVGRKGSLLRVSVSAVVGANGSGKSSLVEYILRLLNNFAASIFGEAELHPGAEHLHFIEGIYGELYYMLNDQPHLLKVAGDRVAIYEYEKCRQTAEEEESNIHRYKKVDGGVFLRDTRRRWRPDDDICFYSKWRKRPSVFQRVADHIFYTFVSNYSLYAYNSNDYQNEWNSEAIEIAMRSADSIQNLKKNGKSLQEMRCWLEGIFHKNDGYQTPIVLTPYRVKGNLDVNKEAGLSSERLLTLLLKGLGYDRLNEHLMVEGFELRLSERSYGLEYLQKECEDFNAKKRGYKKIRNAIIEAWKTKFKLTFAKSQNLEGYEKALEYLACKTIKVASKYIQYRKYYDKISRPERWIKRKHIDEIHGLIDVMSYDQSHITTKIRQTLCFLSRGAYSEDYLTLGDAVRTSDVAMHSMKEDWKNGNPLLYTRREDVLPAPFIHVDIRLKEKNGNTILLDKLSSGEKQQIYSISSILYHLSNIDSVHTDLNKKRVAYRRVLVVLEEIELYYHPELQRQFIKYLLDGLMQIRLSQILAINILVVTHSPFVLSDIPTSSILALKDGAPQDRDLRTFGANIHDLLSSSFFMEDGSRGLFAEWVIKDLVRALDIHSRSSRSEVENRFLRNYPRQKIHRLIMSIDEPIIQRILLEKYKQSFTKQTAEEKIAELELEIKRLKDVASKTQE